MLWQSVPSVHHGRPFDSALAGVVEVARPQGAGPTVLPGAVPPRELLVGALADERFRHDVGAAGDDPGRGVYRAARATVEERDVETRGAEDILAARPADMGRGPERADVLVGPTS